MHCKKKKTFSHTKNVNFAPKKLKIVKIPKLGCFNIWQQNGKLNYQTKSVS